MRLIELLLSLCLLGQISSATAQGPAPLAFTETQLPNAPVGHVSLSWNPLAEGTRYEVIDQDGQRMYQGEVPLAFISGLPDGTHTFHLKAFAADGTLLAEAAQPAIVPVKHWSLKMAFSLFGVGLTVFLILIGVIVHGTLTTRSEPGKSIAEKTGQGNEQEASA